MQGKVSMVVPCYNKEKYIGAMLESVLAQVWDNIELILINDGSTDRTCDVIAEYLPKLIKRGYDCKLIDQKNGGCSKAVHTGLLNMTGDYFCLVDADDEIEPQYVSKMAGWLDEHDDYAWAACTYRLVTISDGKRLESEKWKTLFSQDTDNLLTHYIFRNVITTVWIYMTRTDYIRQCSMINNFCTEWRRVYEPLIMVPLASGGGKMKFFDEALYRYNRYASDLYGFDRIEKAKAYYDDYLYLYEWSIKKLRISDIEKKRYLMMAKLSYQLELFKQLENIKRACEETLANETMSLINSLFSTDMIIPSSNFFDAGYISIFNAIESAFIKQQTARRTFSRIIGYGALGRAAKRILPQLIGTDYMPIELWDEQGDNRRIRQPDFSSLSESDLMLVFPTTETVIEELKTRLDGCPATIYYKGEIELLLCENKYPQIERLHS